MTYWLVVVIVVLAGLALGALLWALRTQAVIRRLHAGMLTLTRGEEVLPLARSPEDIEAVLGAFDRLAAQIAEDRRDYQIQDRGRELEVFLERMVSMLRQPLVAIQSYATLITQAPEIPATGDTHELLQKLHTQVTGLLKLFESSADVGQLRAGISGLQKELALLTPSRPSPTILVVDEEAPWVKELGALVRPERINVLTAPGSDAAVVMARSIHPRVLLANVGRHDALGWKALSALRHERKQGEGATVLYRLSADAAEVAYWRPADVWFWPLPNNDDSRIVRQSLNRGGTRLYLHGQLELATEVSRWLSGAGLAAEPGDDVPPLVIDGGVTLTLKRNHGVAGQSEEFILIIPTKLASEAADRLINCIERQAEGASIDVEQFKGRIADIASITPELSAEELVR